MSFIEIGNRLINLAHVREVRRHSSYDKETKETKSGATVFYTDGSSDSFHNSSLAYAAFGSLEQHAAKVVPAFPGFFQISFWFYDEKPDMKNMGRRPIVAWRVGLLYGSDLCTPIILDEEGPDISHGETAILQPDGTVQEPGNMTWDSLEEWIKYAQEQWKTWKKKKAEKAA